MYPQSAQRLLAPLLAPLGAGYAALMALRRGLWEKGRAFTPSCPCVAVGNIAWGGTGKTPLVDWLLTDAARQRRRAVVLTRGYRACPPELPYPVTPHSPPAEAGDEPLMLCQNHPEAAVLVDPVRARAARLALDTLAPDLLLLDDGFQHLAVGRHLNLVLLRPEDVRADWNRVIPAGPWREGAGALRRADAFLIKADAAALRALWPDLRARLSVFGRPLFSFRLCPAPPRRVGTGHGAPPGGVYALLSGVGNPRQVRATAARLLGSAPTQHLIFPDHHAYTAADVARIRALKLPVLCTSKDAVKLAGSGLEELWEMPVTLRFGPALWSERAFPDWWEGWFSAAAAALRAGLPAPAPQGFAPGTDWLEPEAKEP